MDDGLYMFVVVVPPRFESNLRAGPPARAAGQHRRDRHAAGEHRRQLHPEYPLRPRSRATSVARSGHPPSRVKLVVRKAFNPNGDTSWFTSIVAIINQITMLTIILTGAALIREREHGTIEHLLVMPLTAFEIAMAKVWANGLVDPPGRRRVALLLVVRTILGVPIAGSPGSVHGGRRPLPVLRDRRSASSWARSPGPWPSSPC